MSSAARRRRQDVKLLRRYIKHQTAVLTKRSHLMVAREHAEDVHQMRVASRRLRAALYAMGKGKSKTASDIRWLTGKLGPLRDLDVQIEQLGDTNGATRGYRQYLESQRKSARRQLHRAIKTKRLQRLLKELDSLQHGIGKDAGLNLRAAIYKELQHIRRSGGRIRADSPFERLHRLRIHCKRLRYQIEILQPSSETSLDSALLHLKQLLERLGELQDSRITVAHILEYEDTLEADAADHRNLERMLAEQERRAERIRQAFPADWQHFDKKLDRCLADLQRVN